MDDTAAQLTGTISLSHFEREIHAQQARTFVGQMTVRDLRGVRAWLLDVVQNELTSHMDLAKVRGEVVHEAIQTLEQMGPIKRYWFQRLGSHWESVDAIARFPDLDPPDILAMKNRQATPRRSRRK